MTFFSQTPMTSPHLTRLSIIASFNTNADTTPEILSDKTPVNSNFSVPRRSQMLTDYQGLTFGGGQTWGSPTSMGREITFPILKKGRSAKGKKKYAKKEDINV
jgi:hypothetical protein